MGLLAGLLGPGAGLRRLDVSGCAAGDAAAEIVAGALGRAPLEWLRVRKDGGG